MHKNKNTKNINIEQDKKSHFIDSPLPPPIVVRENVDICVGPISLETQQVNRWTTSLHSIDALSL